ncbi:MAG: hypothetical protein HZB13_05570 [Acidobacteria bacterium]|nr:hypothetical protein [Acidobacteriota bacterium]
MAHYIQSKVAIPLLTLGVAAAVLAAAAPRRPFSHKYHLTQVPSCESCHSAAAESTKAADNLIPDKSACVNCHDEVDIAPPHTVGVQSFNHSKHVKMGNPARLFSGAVRGKSYLGESPPVIEALAAAKDACEGCHHGIPESESVPRDRAVKAHFPQMADCLVCHNKIEPPYSCVKCHTAPAAGFKPPSHGPEFGDTHSSKDLPKAACAVCHGRRFTCKGCH